MQGDAFSCSRSAYFQTHGLPLSQSMARALVSPAPDRSYPDTATARSVSAQRTRPSKRSCPAPAGPTLFCQQIPCKAVRAAEPVAALCEVNVLIALYFQQLLARQQDSIDHAEHRMAAQIDILKKVPVINALIVEWAERVRVEMDKFHVRVCLKKCTDIFLCLNGADPHRRSGGNADTGHGPLLFSIAQAPLLPD